MKTLKALLVNGSPRAKGCTFTALTELKKTLEAEGIEVELIHVGTRTRGAALPVVSARPRESVCLTMLSMK